ncbi:MAG: peptidase M28 family protein [Calditrichaeota bacterium]|nr:MAG: peptidase M28 family protein [Calditrichota bacterium]MBL1205284.1 peptidase M28 family protein [Calditrichota bacterium]NOG45113.1 M20/M25/M40 family metallo-hydrolase [Calditrichota bacterium]
MNKSFVYTLLFGLFVFWGSLFSQTKDSHKTFINKIYSEALVKTPTHKLLKELTTKFPHRLSGSKGADGAVKWTKQVMQDFGFDNVFLQDVMVEHWERGEKEQAYIVDKNGNKVEFSILALGRSISTPESGITAEVVKVQSLDEVAELGREKIEGKIVFYNRSFEHKHLRTFSGYVGTVNQRTKGPSQAARYGAIAVVIRSVSSGDDDFPHTGTLGYAKDAPQIPAGALGNHSANKLAEILESNPQQKLFLKINSQTLPDAKSYNVIGEIKGSEHPEKIIAVGGHLDAWDVGQGAHDDGSGCMQSISALKILQRMGYKPKHTLRAVMFINEENGLRGGKTYADSAVNKKEKHIIAIESDAGGFTPRAFGLKGPDSTLAKMQEWLKYFPDYTIESIKKGYGGPDINPLNKADGTPTIGLVPDSQRYFDFHHSPADVFSAVNKRELELGTASMATLIYLVDQFGL